MNNLAIRTLATVLAATGAVYGQGGFGGPSILSRGGGGLGASRGQALGVTVYGSVQGTYNYGFSPIRPETNLVVPRLSGPGVMTDGGILGYSVRQRYSTSFALRGLYSLNSTGNNFNNHGLNLETAHSHQFGRKAVFFLSAAAAKTNYSGQFLYRFTQEPVAQTINPGFEIFDNHLTTVSFAAGLTYRLTRRISLSTQGGAYGNDRLEKGLADTRGTSGTGSIQFSPSRKTAIGGSFTYDYFFFPGQFGESHARSSQVFFNQSVGRRWSFGVKAGVFSVRTERLTLVRLDPLIASITGQTEGLQIFRRTNLGWLGGGNLTGTFRNSSLEFSFNRSLQAGNGVYLTSTSDLASLTYLRSARNGWTYTGSATYSKLGALTQALGPGIYRTVGGSASRRINSYMNAIGSAGYFNTSVFSGNFSRDRFYVTAGVQFSPRDLPLLR